MGPYLMYFSITTWFYPLKDIIGEASCHIFNIFRGAILYEVQLQSFFMSLFRYICLFHAHIMGKYHLTPQVSFLAINCNSKYDLKLLPNKFLGKKSFIHGEGCQKRYTFEKVSNLDKNI